MNKLRSKRITLTLCETLIYKSQNPKPSCAEIRSSLPRRPRQALPCARTGLTAHEATSTDPPVRRTSPPAHEVTSTGPPVRRTSPPAHEANSTGPPVRRTSPPAHEATSTGPPVRRTGLTAHEANSTGHPVRQKVIFAHETDEYDSRCAGRTLSRTENHSKGRQSIGR